MAPSLHNIFKALLNGVHARGEEGVLHVRGEVCAYRVPADYSDASFRGALERLLEEDAGQHFYVVEERDGKLHLLAYDRARVVRDARGGAGGQSDDVGGASSIEEVVGAADA